MNSALSEVPRPEHPRPQLRRDRWINLNGAWTCRRHRRELGHLAEPALIGGRRLEPEAVGPFLEQIIVPFAPESRLSGIGLTDFTEGIDYHRRLEIPADWQRLDLLLHFAGVDFHTDVYLDGHWAGSHSGGSAPFTVDVTPFARAGGVHDLTVVVQDYIHSGDQPGGKQSHHGDSYGCYYTRTTGIWQTVWMEAVHPSGLADLTVTSSVQTGALVCTPRLRSTRSSARLNVRAAIDGHTVATASAPCSDGLPVRVLIPEPRLWSPEDPALYDLEIEVETGEGIVDRVTSYAGMREVVCRDGKVLLNGEPRYLRFVLDQGFYPDGIWTAPSDEALRRDIELSMAAGFNGARLHQKVFEDRFHYWADRLGYLTWSEWPSWGLEHNSTRLARTFLTEVREVVVHLRNHPSIIAWTPFNETARCTNPRAHRLNHTDAYDLCRSLDPTRPVNDASGYAHQRTDLWTVHTYVATGDELRAQLAPEQADEVAGPPYRNFPDREVAYAGQPYIVDEFGGIKWTGEASSNGANVDRTQAWGYGGTPGTEREFLARLGGLVDALLSLDHVAGWCYTQLTDVEQEQNGVYFYDRREKFPADTVRAIFGREPKGFGGAAG